MRQGGALDGEAAARGTSVYLADERLDMLPGELSADKCSLVGGEDRPAVSVIWTLAPGDLSVSNLWFGRTLIRCIPPSRHVISSQGDVFRLLLINHQPCGPASCTFNSAMRAPQSIRPCFQGTAHVHDIHVAVAS